MYIIYYEYEYIKKMKYTLLYKVIIRFNKKFFFIKY